MTITRPPLVILRRALLLCAGVTAGTVLAQASKVQFKIATVAPEQSAWGQTIKEIAAEIPAASGGTASLKCYFGGVQGDEATVIRKMRIGQLDGGGFMGRGMVDLCPDAMVMQLPLLFRNEEEIDAVFPKFLPYLSRQAAQHGFVVLGWPRLGFSYTFSKDEIRDLASLRRAKPWLVGEDEFSKAFYTAAGLTGVAVPVSDVLTGLQSGLIHTVFAPPLAMIAVQWHSRVKYRLDQRLGYSLGGLFVSAKKWDQLPVDVQRKLRDLCEAKITLLNAKTRKQNDEALAAMAAAGIRTLTPDEHGRQEFADLNTKVTEKLVGKEFSPEALAEVEKFLKAVRQAAPPTQP